ncbi:unnamed protein product [Peronospora belbahrii]|uniref:Peroxisome assembly protein 12 n=1 Tax=Peronospora belbahrii TaxID=622444 RepID=A0AAU9LT37_9STRA|nr:unnamed protein product [Peronospora belbahrii]CAH0516161.1 unnamed protein product [Peronospora belbahrii]
MLFLEQTQGFARDDRHACVPSLFELLMQERMAEGFKPALDYLVTTLCESYPNVALSLPVRYFEESYALLRYCIESYFLSRYDGLATEKFYGMKRVIIVNENAKISTSALTSRARRLTLFFAVIVPYLKTKLDVYYKETVVLLARTTGTNTRNASANGGTREQRMSRFLQRLQSLAYLQTLQKGFVATYPYAHFVYQGSFFFYHWLYLLGDTPFFSPFLRCMKTVLVRVTADDESIFRQHEAKYREKVLTKLSGSGITDRIRRLLVQVTWATVDHSYVLLLLGIAGYKFIEWMYSEEGVSVKLRLTGTDAPIPPPPLPPQFSGPALALATMNPALCPLCKKKRANPAMTPSGYVFCYPCIYRYIEQHGECPITQIKCELATIAKIYDDARDS